MECFNFVGVGAKPWMVKAKKKKSQAKPNQTKTTLIKQPQNKNKPLNKTKQKNMKLPKPLAYLYTQLHSLGVFLELSSRITCLWEASSSSNYRSYLHIFN